MLEALKQVIRDSFLCRDFSEGQVDELASEIYQEIAENLDISQWGKSIRDFDTQFFESQMREIY